MKGGVFSKALTARLVGQAHAGQSRARPVPHVVVLLVGTGLFLLLQATGAQGGGPPPQANLLERLTALEAEVSALTSTVGEQAAEIAALTAALATEAASREQGDADLSGEIAGHTHDWTSLDLTPFTRELFDPEDPGGGYNVVLTGANLHLRNGWGQTSCMNYLGNLVIGYNEDSETWWDALSQTWVPWTEADRSGSHNIVLGSRNTYTSHSGLVAGVGNRICAPVASVTGGYFNTASAVGASVCGGHQNLASGERSSVLGGMINTASGYGSSVSAGYNNTASSDWCSVSGGCWNSADGNSASVSGGVGNTANAYYASVSGGNANTASGTSASVSGGEARSASGAYDWRAGGLFEDY